MNVNYLSVVCLYPIRLIDGLIVYLKTLRDGKYVIDYSDDGGATWELEIVSLERNEDSLIIEIDTGVLGDRQVIRSGSLCIDEELTPTGFAGDEDIDWIEMINIRPE